MLVENKWERFARNILIHGIMVCLDSELCRPGANAVSFAVLRWRWSQADETRDLVLEFGNEINISSIERITKPALGIRRVLAQFLCVTFMPQAVDRFMVH